MKKLNVDILILLPTRVVPEVVDGVERPLPEGSIGLWDLYTAADLVTCPSLYEGFGNALIEAFDDKVPVLINVMGTG